MTDAENFAQAAPLAPASIRLSRTETETLCFKAARGAGYSWGIAEEAGAAAGWLCANGIDGTAALLVALVAPSMTAPVVSTGAWVSRDGRDLCPRLTGTALVDFEPLSDGPFSEVTDLGPVRQPVLLLPFLSRCAKSLDAVVRLDWGEKALFIGQSISAKPSDLLALINAPSATVRLSISETPEAPPAAPDFVPAHPHTLHALNALALRTTVPASDASRNSGAGAGTTDND